MIPRSSLRTVIAPDLEYLLAFLDQWSVASPVDLVLDPSLSGSAPVRTLVTSIRRIAPQLRVHTPADLMLSDQTSPLSTQSLVIAIGGGTTIDATKLATRFRTGDCRSFRTSHRSALVTIPPLTASPDVVAVPTTLGTGSEVSRVAVGDGRRLWVGEGLQPALALHDPDLLRTLPRPLLIQGAVEIFARVLGPSLDRTRSDGIDDALAETLLTGITAALRSIVAGVGGEKSIAEALRIGALSHDSVFLAGSSPYSVKWWALNHEICGSTGSRKVPALVAALPIIVDRILAGDERWGSLSRLVKTWQVILGAWPEVAVHDPGLGIRTLLHMTGERPDPRLCELPVEHIAHQAAMRWGRGLPMLQDFTHDDLVQVLTDTRTEARVVAARGPGTLPVLATARPREGR